ncbi:Ig-like domain-containing protein [Sulfidibacter corallicola]|uniref:Uncharacterized protein n=1 Tax=Sulfidibacter corallicola TaxID=2818388 RepID=A0A8A4TNQ7_SULCO|nr:Ig-like domain-containing protein [Sulfidibacter corallicola]QTD50732.1 hypothetical protein J3U87_34535 [Sulfidibacter corallicola]
MAHFDPFDTNINGKPFITGVFDNTLTIDPTNARVVATLNGDTENPLPVNVQFPSGNAFEILVGLMLTEGDTLEVVIFDGVVGDGGIDNFPARFTHTVPNENNTPPVGADATFNGGGATIVTKDMSEFVSDAEDPDSALILKTEENPTWGTVTWNGTEFTAEVTELIAGDVSFEYSIEDSEGATSPRYQIILNNVA